jgi:hypothetical protein
MFALDPSRQRSSKAELEQADFIACHIFASGDSAPPTGTPEWSLVMFVDLTFKDASQARSRRVFIVSNVRYSVIQQFEYCGYALRCV